MAQFKFYNPKKNSEIYLVGEFNNWGKDLNNLEKYKFSEENFPIYTLQIPLDHKTSYLFKVDGSIIRDPSAVLLNNDAGCVYWDYSHSDAYKFKYARPEIKNKANVIIQTDLPGLIKWYRAEKSDYINKLGGDVKVSEYYKFITQSGVIDTISNLNFNIIQFLPLTKSVDGKDWKVRYLAPFSHAINEDWGTPDEFSEMIDAFHVQGIGLLHDAVYSHVPYKNYTVNKTFDFLCNLPSYFMGEETSWGTKRYNYSDANVRNLLTDSAVHFLKNYNFDGFRIDNVDGILRFGDNGDGAERPGGRTFLRELNTAIYENYPNAIVNFEAHYFSGENAKRLVGALDKDPMNLGATAYNSSRETFFFHTEYMIKSGDKIKVSRIKEIIDEKEWGESNACIADFHNHDAASGIIEDRATGSYAYDAIICKNHHLHHHAVGKIKVMEAVISFGLEGRTLDLLQTFLMQTGSFEHDSSIQWYLQLVEANSALVNYKKKVNEIMKLEDFWSSNVKYRKIINVDEKNKTITFKRNKHIIFINLSSDMLPEYEFSVYDKDEILPKGYKIIFNSDEFKYCGSGRTLFPEYIDVSENKTIKFSWIAGYNVIVLEEVGE